MGGGKHISDAYDSGETLHDLLSFFCFCCFDIVFITAFCRAVFLSADVGEIVFAEPLVDFRDGVPASAVLLDATLLHVEINQVLLLTVRYYAFGRTDNGEFDKLGLDAAVVQTHGVSATVPMDEPLAQVGGHFYVDVVVAHNIRVEWL